MELNHPPQIQLDTVSENCFFYISPMYEFSHSQGSFASFRRDASYVCLTPPKADMGFDIDLSREGPILKLRASFDVAWFWPVCASVAS